MPLSVNIGGKSGDHDEGGLTQEGGYPLRKVSEKLFTIYYLPTIK